jgi:hypothetical protein
VVPGTYLAELLDIGSHNSAKCVPGTSLSAIRQAECQEIVALDENRLRYL